MSKGIRIWYVLMLSGVLCSAETMAQNHVGAGFTDFAYIKQSEAWLNSYNAGGLRYLPVDQISIAEIYANKQNGQFVNYYQSNNSYDLGAQVESFYRLTPRVVFYGKVNYNYFRGKNMGGSAFIDPYYNPFDILEYPIDKSGDKEKETYHLIGAVSGDLLNNLTLAGKIDYQSANYAKFKDLRHKNKMLDMYVTAGLTYRINRFIEVGANYYYRRSTEGLDFKAYGSSDTKDSTFIDYGAYLGITEIGETGYTEHNEEKPMFNEFNGVSLQLNLRICPQLSFFNEFTYKSRDGYYGKRSPSTIVFSEHSGDVYEYSGALSLSKGKNHHQLRIDLSWEDLDNYQNTYRSEAGTVGNSVITYYDPLKVGDRQTGIIKAEYTGNLGVENHNPQWVLNAGAAYTNRWEKAHIYPFYRKQTIYYTDYHANATRNIVKGNDMYTFMLGASFLSGGGTPKEDGLYAPQTASQVFPENMENTLNREYEYLTNDRISGRIGFKYSRLFNAGIRGYASINYSLTKASGIEYLAGNTFNRVSFVVGCAF